MTGIEVGSATLDLSFGPLDILGNHQHQGDGVLGGRDGGGVGCVANSNASFGCCVDVDLLVADPGASDDLEPGSEVHQFAVVDVLGRNDSNGVGNRLIRIIRVETGWPEDDRLRSHAGAQIRKDLTFKPDRRPRCNQRTLSQRFISNTTALFGTFQLVASPEVEAQKTGLI